jgi:hypothetical protein
LYDDKDKLKLRVQDVESTVGFKYVYDWFCFI